MAIGNTLENIPDLADEDFEVGREFLDSTLESLRGFDGYKGAHYPRSQRVTVDISPDTSKRMFFKIADGRVGQAQVTLVTVGKEGNKNSKSVSNIHGLELTEAQNAAIVYSPESRRGEARAVLETPFALPDMDNAMERALYLMVRRRYTVHNIGSLSIAVVDKHVTKP